MNFKTLEEAVKLIRDKFKVNFIINNCNIEQFPETNTTFGNFVAHIKVPQTIKLETTVMTDHASWIEQTDIEYVIFEKDLLDESLVDKVIGGDLKNYDLEKRMVLRLAFILYNGIKYGVDREVRKKDIDAGWHPRVISVKMRY